MALLRGLPWLTANLLPMAVVAHLALFAGGSSAEVAPLPPSAPQAQHVFQLPNDNTKQEQSLDAEKDQVRLHGRFLHITDFHPDKWYKVHSNTNEKHSCHYGKGLAGVYGAETSSCDSPHQLVDSVFGWIQANIKDQIDFVVWTGDSARHDSDKDIDRDADSVLESNKMMADKFEKTFSDKKGLTIPIIPTFGNNDILPHNVMKAGPNKWLNKYTDIWAPFIPESQTQSFQQGGSFSVEVIPNKLAVFSLNTMYFFSRNAGINDCVDPKQPGTKELEWLRVQLQTLRERGMKAILTGHVPPARTQSKENWDETCWQKYTLWLQQYRDVVLAGLYGHMNIDHFMLQDTKDLNLRYFEKGTPEYRQHRAEKRRERKMNKSWAVIQSEEPTEGGVSAMSGADYLMDLRNMWAQLPKDAVQDDNDDDDDDDDDDADADGENDGSEADSKTKKKKNEKKKNKKKKKKHDELGGQYAERYQLSLVSPSIVPNYFPTLRVFEYNITGIENNPTWVEVQRSMSHLPDPPEETEGQSTKNGDVAADKKKKKHKKHKKNKRGKKKKHKKKKKKHGKDPNLVVPDPPSKSSPPGPAYSPQTLTLTGFTQYFANLTYLNNDTVSKDDQISSTKWNEGIHNNKKPKHKPKPLPFEFQPEYDTFNDKIYGLDDLTVRSWVDLAARIAQDPVESKDDLKEEGQAGDGSDDMVDQGKKKKKKKKKKRHNQAWIHFLRHAFVSTLDKHEVEELAEKKGG